jgi:hypothetical protein
LCWLPALEFCILQALRMKIWITAPLGKAPGGEWVRAEMDVKEMQSETG